MLHARREREREREKDFCATDAARALAFERACMRFFAELLLASLALAFCRVER